MRKTVKVGAVIAIAVVIIVVLAVALNVQDSTSPVFKIVDKNFNVGMGMDENFNVILNYTVYVKIKNEGADGSKTVWCEVIRQDLSTIKRSQSVFLKTDTDKTITFFFTHSDIKGAVSDNYKAWID